MIHELIKFTENLDEEFKRVGSMPKEGLHIFIQLRKNKELIIEI